MEHGGMNVPIKSKAARAHKCACDRERYAWYKEHHICPNCKTTSVEPGHVFCKACLKKRQESRHSQGREYYAELRKERRQRLKEQGLCVDCGKRPAQENNLRCVTCNRNMEEQRQVHRIHERIKAQNAKEVEALKRDAD